MEKPVAAGEGGSMVCGHALKRSLESDMDECPGLK